MLPMLWVMLFSLFINDPKTESSNKVAKFADDTKLC